MPIDTSSYYPEVPGEEELNTRKSTLFGDGPRRDGPVPELPESLATVPEPDNEQNGCGDRIPRNRFADAVSHFISWVSVPLLMPVYGVLLAFNLSILDFAPVAMKTVFTLVIFGIDTVLPLLFIILLKKFGVVGDYGLNGRKERLVPYIMTIVSYLGSAWFMHAKGAPMWLPVFFAGGALAAVVNMIVNFWWKISAHAAGIAGIVALTVYMVRDGWSRPDCFWWMLASIIFAGLVGSARVWMGRHTLWQVLAGYSVGFTSVFLLMI